VTLEAAKAALTKSGGQSSSAKLQWMKDWKDELVEAGGDGEKAWRLYNEGRTDGIAWQLEEALVEELMNLEYDEDEDEDEEDEEEDEDDEEEEEEEEDEDE
jgi:type III secretion system FlhB-like substrate exporter